MNEMTSEFNVTVTLDRSSGTSLRAQILDQLKAAIGAGVLAPGDPLPSSRTLAEHLGVSRTTVLGCYQELEGEGWVFGAHGAGTFVARPETPAAAQPSAPAVESAAAEFSYDFRPGSLDPALVGELGWRDLWRAVAASDVPAPASGLLSLRQALAAYLTSARGLPCSADQIVVCAGTAEAVALLSVALGWAGKAAAVEDPGYPEIRRLLQRMSVQLKPIDATQGVAAHLASAEPLAAAYLTPSHQYPLGHRMVREERHAVIEWADRTGAVVVEDDYDGEFHFGVPPSTSMAGLSPDSNVVYVGTMSKVLDPGLRLAYLRVPPHLVDQVCAARTDLGSTVAAPVQAAVATLVQSGQLSRHIARVRRIYGDRRRALIQSLNECPAVRGLTGIDAGLHLVANLEPGVDARGVAAEAASRGLAVADLDDFRMCPAPDSPALVLGFARHSPAAIRAAVAVLNDSLVSPAASASPDRDLCPPAHHG